MNKLIFFHVPKCGGTSLEKAFADNYGENSVLYPATVHNYLVTPPEDLEKFTVLAGHITHDVALPFIHKDVVLIALFRSLDNRIRSLYNYNKDLNDNSEESNLANSLDFIDWLNSRSPSVLVNIQNAVVRQFTPESYWDTNRAANPLLIIKSATNFIEKFNIIGLVEDINNFYAKVEKKFNIKIDKKILNKSKNDYTTDVSDEILNTWIIKNSELDIQFMNVIYGIMDRKNKKIFPFNIF